MRMHYSQDADAIYIRLKEDRIHNTNEVTPDIIMDKDLDKFEHVVKTISTKTSRSSLE